MTDLVAALDKMTWSQWAISILFLACCAVTWVGTWLTLVTHQAQQERDRRELAELVKAREWLDGRTPPTVSLGTPHTTPSPIERHAPPWPEKRSSP